MLDKGLLALARLVLPIEVVEHFDIREITYVERDDYDEPEAHIHLDEKMNTSLQNDVHFESKGFTSATNITDFPIRDHKVVLVIRRRRWVDLRTGNSFVLPLSLTAEGTRYSKSFAAFLKETYGHIPGDLPYA